MKEKVNTHFSFPLRLDMTPYTEDFLMGKNDRKEGMPPTIVMFVDNWDVLKENQKFFYWPIFWKAHIFFSTKRLVNYFCFRVQFSLNY